MDSRWGGELRVQQGLTLRLRSPGWTRSPVPSLMAQASLCAPCLCNPDPPFPAKERTSAPGHADLIPCGILGPRLRALSPASQSSSKESSEPEEDTGPQRLSRSTTQSLSCVRAGFYLELAGWRSHALSPTPGNSFYGYLILECRYMPMPSG